MNRHQFLSGLHERLEPRSYLEIGINDGRGLAQSRTRTIGVDPAFKVNVELACDLQLVKATSDDFFAAPDPLAWFAHGAPDLAFIDGMHLFEFALRDFINTERHSEPAGVIVLDDMLPRSVDEAARDRHTAAWTGDVYKVAMVLEQHRPDLTVVPLETAPTGLVLVVGLDPANRTLTEKYDEILAEHVYDDPQRVPDSVMHRTDAADPEAVLANGAWAEVVLARSERRPADPGALADLAALRGSASYHLDPPHSKPWPPKKVAKKAAKKAAKKTASPPARRRLLRR
ncbi:MAG TPA: class I SAM-dependent methyltransferase [Mycobacteriales bacterium]|nr:class I SAM-dependent methyltransferase [Mycobacteriales bacterium]